MYLSGKSTDEISEILQAEKIVILRTPPAKITATGEIEQRFR